VNFVTFIDFVPKDKSEARGVIARRQRAARS
jgi:hypothetical protein